MNNKIKMLSMAIVILVIPIAVMAEPVSHRPNQKIEGTTYGSYNWAGYVVQSGTYTEASGSWVVPTIQPTVSGYSSAWVGVGGFNGNTVIQIGTEQSCLAGSATAGERKYHGADDKAVVDNANNNVKSVGGGSSCTPIYYAWWELYPQNSEQKISDFTVNPGDTITASVSENSDSTWTLIITDTTTEQSFTTTQTPTFVPDQASAEVIMERPSLCNAFICKLTNLANFGTIDFNSASSDSGLFDSSADGIIMVGKGRKVMAYPTPNPITTSGVFSVQWVRNS